jgi:hypothetical protein
MKEILFLLFNGGGTSYDQWYNHPYPHNSSIAIKVKTDFVLQLESIGNVYTCILQFQKCKI